MDRIGFIGLGTMGSAMAANIVRAGFPLTVWNRTAGRAPELADLGATFATTAAEVAAASDVVVVCVSDTPDVEAVLFGPDGVTAGAQEGTLIIDCSTIAPSGSWKFAERLDGLGLVFVDAPVSGGSEGARNATLTIFVGGARTGRRAGAAGARPRLAGRSPTWGRSAPARRSRR